MKTPENNHQSININGIVFRELLPEDARQVAGLHIKGIHTGFISSLGIDFVTAVYEAIASSKHAFGLAALKGDNIVGFVTFSTSTGALYKSVIFKKGFRFAFLLAGKLFSPKKIRNIIQTALYPARTKNKIQLPQAELLSIVVAEEERGKGLSKALIREGFSLCRQRNIEEVRLLVGSDNKPANSLYQKCGFTLACQIQNHGILSNLYAGKTNHFHSR
jgi:ribosomal protein S18 acetylase RimI-like enzyme